MAEFILNIEASSFEVKQLPSIVTDCSTIFLFELTATVGNSVRISLDNAVQTSLNFNNATFTFEGLEVEWDGADKVFTYSSPIYFSYSIANSGTPGLFKKVKAEAWDDTTTEDYNYWYQITERTNDNLPCDNPTGGILTYDELTDTPEDKIGSALKLVRVNAAEDAHEYVDVGLLSSSSAQKIIQSVRFGEAVSKGDPLVITGYHGSTGPAIVEKADATDDIKMPAYGVALEDYAINETGLMIALGDFNDFNTSGYGVGDTLYVAVGGGMTNVKPTGTSLIQNIGIVSRSNLNNGQVEIVAIGRANDVPNLPEGRIWVGDENTLVSDTVYIDEPNNRLGIGTTSPSSSLHVETLASGPTARFINTSGTGGLGVWIQGGSGSGSNILVLSDYSNNERLRVRGDGNVGIGTTNPSEKLHVSGAIIAETLFIRNIDGYNAKLLSDNLTTNKTFNFPDNGGTLAITSDIPSASQWDDVTGGINYANGNVGIGTASPSAALNIVNLNPKILLEDSDNAGTYGQIRQQAGNLQFISSNNTTNGTIQFRLNDGTTTTDAMRINSLGNVGIGTTNPSAKLQVEGIAFINAGNIKITNNSVTNYYDSTQMNSYGTHYDWKFSGSSIMRINSSGNVGIGTTSPRAKLEVGGFGSLGAITNKVVSTIIDGGYSTTNQLQYNTQALIGTSIGSLTDIFTNTGSETKKNFYVGIISDNSYFNNPRWSVVNNGAERLVVDQSTGNVGIGTTSPGQKLEVVGTFLATGNSTIGGRTNLEQDLIIRGTDSAASQGVARFYVDSSNRLFIDTANDGQNLFTIGASGSVGIGTTNPSAALEVAAAVATNVDIAHFSNSNDIAKAKISLSANSSGELSLIDGLNNTDVFITSNGDSYFNGGEVLIGTTTSTGAKLIVDHDNTKMLELKRNGNTKARFIADSNNGQLDLYNSATQNTIRLLSSGDSYFNGGNVGIGTTSPSQKLSLELSDTNTTQATFKGMVLSNIDTTVNNGSAISFSHTAASSNSHAKIGAIYEDRTGGSEDTSLFFGTLGGGAYGEKMRITSAGNVGIGTTAPEKMLDVRGVVMSEEFKVKTINDELTFPTDTGEEGEIRFTANYIYVCVAANTWKRTELTSWSV